jgi:hypothetical protein
VRAIAAWLVLAATCLASGEYQKPTYQFTREQRELLELAGVVEPPPKPEKVECVLPDDDVAAPARLWKVTITKLANGHDELWHGISEPIWKCSFMNRRGRARGDLVCIGVKVINFWWEWGLLQNEVLVRWRRLAECTDWDFVIEPTE